MKTCDLQIAIYKALRKNGTYLCFEVMMPSIFLGGNGFANERVDLLTYDVKGTWRFYELKVSVADFHSKAKHTFWGNFNYYVMPIEVYKMVKNEIPKGVGCYVSKHGGCWSIKKAEKQELKVNENALSKAFIQALSREHGKFMNIKIKDGEPK